MVTSWIIQYITGYELEVNTFEEDQDQILKTKLLLTVSLLIIPAGVIWGAVYLFWGETLAATMPILYSLFSVISIIYLRITKNFVGFRTMQLLLILIFPFLFMLALGGFTPGSVAFIWSVMAPFGAILFYQTQHSNRWLYAYLGLLVLTGIVQPSLRSSTNLPAAFVTAMFVLNIGILSIITYNLLNNFVRGKNRLLDLLKIEQKKSEQLLLNVLPKEIASELKNGHKRIARHYPSASVMFADIVGFTRLSEEIDPAELVDVLNQIFSDFDTMVEGYALEKIRTIGDNYMVAAGVPVPRSDHAAAITNLAIDMCDYIDELPAINGHKINFRVGINSGPLIAGIIGRKKFHYDIWGDTVNTASRMESTGEPGRIQVTPATLALLGPNFAITRRGNLVVKGKGELETWFIDGRHHTSSDYAI
jgi:adenylate cyclase